MKPMEIEKRMCVRTVSYTILFLGSCIRRSLTYLQDKSVNFWCLHL